ncbi:hypothetical protein GCM10025867_39380 [Frondihabitans sucicola]|uniref:SMP-30/Gluconolactonase/LRE-like region domain-containing protein n=1 Tax=Frondihabitans sucicola TaxID=1268041 RepID=A0ABN6Y2Y7_9MICO|nr:hypothetical protein [Frondihabitans sucicola]BDZ51697.1 hypothetical protein GCM10025867_39380 [Frondihabitans sucicola]
MARNLLPRQSSRILLVDASTGSTEVVFESATVLVEAPNWTPDGRELVVNADGLLWRLPVSGGRLTPVPMPGVPEINNDHVLAPSGGFAYVSGRDGHLYEVPWPAARCAGSRETIRIGPTSTTSTVSRPTAARSP